MGFVHKQLNSDWAGRLSSDFPEFPNYGCSMSVWFGPASLMPRMPRL